MRNSVLGETLRIFSDMRRDQKSYQVHYGKVKEYISSLVDTGLNPVRAGNIIATFTDKFCYCLKVAIEHGYNIQDNYFRHADGRSIHVSPC
jgi:hypothetical protein